MELNNPTTALRRLVADELSLITGEGQGFQQAATLNVISELGIYRLIFTSRKPEAEAFKRWLAYMDTLHNLIFGNSQLINSTS